MSKLFRIDRNDKGKINQTIKFVAIGVLALSPSFVGAASISLVIDAPATGTISYAGGSTSLIGANIEVASITGIDTPLNAGAPILCNRCIMEFTSGVSTAGNWIFGSGSLSITGGATEPGIPDGSLLLDGIFSRMSVVDSGTGFLTVSINTADSWPDDKIAALCSYFGVPCGNFDGELDIDFTVLGAPVVGDGFSSDTVLSGGAFNQIVIIPVPAAVYLLGSALGLLGWVRRKSVKMGFPL